MTSTKLLLASLLVLLAAASGSANAGSVAAAPALGNIPLGAPTLTCEGSTATTLSVRVTADAVTGAPFGFILEWQPARADDSCQKWKRTKQNCHHEFPATPGASPYSLGPGESVVVTIGNIETLGKKVSDLCNDVNCGQQFCFRTKAYKGKIGKQAYKRSPWSDDLHCATAPCTQLVGLYCTYSQGGFGGTPQGSNPATLLQNPDFPYPVTMCNLSFPDQASIEAYLPKGGQPGVITNPSGGGSLAGQILTAKLNMIVFDLGKTVDDCCTQSGLFGFSFAQLELCFPDGSLDGLNGMSVADAVAAAETALCTGVLPPDVASFGDLAAIMDQLNLNFHSERDVCQDNGVLCLPTS
ncbi:MAG: hypothetical protein ACYTCU_05300 [Planctomycetota bacterium]|jgi:hypothetical protein